MKPSRAHSSLLNKLAAPILGAAILACAASMALADDPIWTTGKIVGPDGKPVAGALVAAYDDQNKVVDYAKTDKNGEYALAVPPRALHLEKHTVGFFASVIGTAARFGGDTVGFVTEPVRSGVHAVTAAESASISDPITKGGVAAGGVVVDKVLTMITPGKRRTPVKADRNSPGAVLVKVVAPSTNDMVEVGKIYWLQSEETKVGGKTRRTIAAWLDPVKLTPNTTEQPSKFESTYLKFTHVRLAPSLAEEGQVVHLQASITIPPDPHVDIVVVARHKSGLTWELHPTTGDTYETDITVDKRLGIDDQAITILAYAAIHEKPGRRKDAEAAINGAGLWDPLKPFQYNPALVVSRNRGLATLTVVKTAKKKN
jgi:Carboxypeptidase regulatory-like domain